MIGVDQSQVRIQLMQSIVSEPVARAFQSKCSEYRIVRDGSKGNNHSSRRKPAQFSLQKNIAGVNFGSERFVLRRKALHGVADAAIEQC